MSTAVLPPSLADASDFRSPARRSGDTTRAGQAISGKETRIAKQTYPRWKWELTYNVLRSGASYGELQQLAGFFNARQGMFDTFLYQDADDSAVTGQTIATGDGATTAFQLIRTFGSFLEPVLAPNVVSAVYLNSVSLPTAGYSAPGAATLSSTAGGSLASTTYYVRTVWNTLQRDDAARHF